MSLKLKKLCKTYDKAEDGSRVSALFNISFSLAKGEFLAVVGPSGCGKTTMLRIIAGLEQPTSGDVVINGTRQRSPGDYVGFVFQEYALFPWRSICSNIEFGLELKGVPRKERRQKALRYLSKFGMPGFEDKYPNEISGGMKQRVAIARTLINEPSIILMDEPFGALDSQTRGHLQRFLLGIWEQSRQTIVFVTHNIDEAIYLSQRVLCISKRPGSVKLSLPIEMPYPRDVTSDEFNRYRKQIIGFLKAEEQGEEMAPGG